MPVGAKEDEVQATGPAGSKIYIIPTDSSYKLTSASPGIMDQVAKESKDSTASSHSVHDDAGVDGKAKATAQDHQANPGPVISQNLGEPASKEESKKRAEELNK